MKIAQQQVNAAGEKLADADFDWFLLQFIDLDLGCSILEARIPGEWQHEIRKLLGNAAGERWAEQTCALLPDTVARLSETVRFEVPENGFEALLTPHVRRQSRPRNVIGGGRASSGFPSAPGFALFLLIENRIPFAIFTGRKGDTKFEDVRKRIVALQEQGLLLSGCRTVGSEVIARYDRGTHDQSTFAPRLMGWRYHHDGGERYHYDGGEEDDIDLHEGHVLPRNTPPLAAHNIETSQLKSVLLPARYQELSVAWPDQGWRLDAYRYVLDEAVRGGWRPHLERLAAWLLGFSEEETEKRLERGRIWRERDEVEREQIREFFKELWAAVRLYVPLVGLCLLFIVVLFLTDQGRDLLVSSQVSFTGGIRLALALNLLCVVAGSAWATLIDVLERSKTTKTVTSELQSPSDTAHSRLKKDSLIRRSFAWLFPSKTACVVALIVPSIIAGVLLIWHSASVALVALLGGPVLMAGLLPRMAKLFRSTRPWWGIGLALAAIIAVALSPASVGIFLGSPLTMAVLVSLWISVVVFLTHLRRKAFSIGALVVALAVAGWLKLAVGSDQRDFIRTVPGADVSHRWKLQSLKDMVNDATSRQSGRPQIVLVAAAGGGVRAAYWTSLLLSRATQPTGGMRDKLIIASGVSGGSLGLAVYRGLLQDNPPDCGVSPRETPLVNCVQNFFANDFLAPPLAATLSGRLLNMILPLSLFPRQNEALENGWESAWRSSLPSRSKAADAFAKPFLDLWDLLGPNGWGRPALALNATALSSGNRLISSGVTIDGWFHPQGNCRANIAEQIPLSLSAAAGASARFPFLSELGWFEPSKQTGCKELEAVGDGGYFDNFGATTISEALHHLKNVLGAALPYVIVIQITSDPDCEIRQLDAADLPEPEGCRPKKTIALPDGRFWLWQTWKDSFNYMKASFETFPYSPNVKTRPADAGPVDLLLQARSAYGMAMAQQLRRQVVCDFKGSYYHFSLAGTTRVPLGWTLSQRSRIEIENLLSSGPNAMELERLLQQLKTGSTVPMHDKICRS